MASMLIVAAPGHGRGNSRKELQEAITASKRFLGPGADKKYKWVHGQVSVDTRRGITYAMDFLQV